MKYKFSIPAQIKSAVEWRLQYYNEDKRQLEKIKNDMIPSPTQKISFTSGVDGGEVGRSTENVAMRIISSPYLRRLEMDCEAIERVLSVLDETDLELIKLIYWRREFTAEGAGLKIGLAKSSTYQRLNKILGAIAYELGYVSL